MNICFFTAELFNGKPHIGSTKLRAHNLIKYWDEASLYKYGAKANVMIYQKVYTTFDFKYQEHFKGIQILDICDPDWKDTPDIYITHTMNLMDAVVVPTETMCKYLQQMTKTPVHVIKDRFDISEFPTPKVHSGTLKTAVWFGYSHNADNLKFAIPSLEKRGIKLIVISNEDPHAYRWALDQNEYHDKQYTFVKYNLDTVYSEIQKADVAVFPEGHRPFDRFKSENKTIISQLCGMPVVKNADELEAMMKPEARNEHIASVYGIVKEEYDCRKSVQEYKSLISQIQGEIRDE